MKPWPDDSDGADPDAGFEFAILLAVYLISLSALLYSLSDYWQIP